MNDDRADWPEGLEAILEAYLATEVGSYECFDAATDYAYEVGWSLAQHDDDSGRVSETPSFYDTYSRLRGELQTHHEYELVEVMRDAFDRGYDDAHALTRLLMDVLDQEARDE